ncbi:MAG: nicotinate-nucleotide adenylyltransferase [Gammaproteobacteria bacterium]|nr:nicotinate-nucleotide adenylyltransferase [Gammaproteobacteria bacterium]
MIGILGGSFDPIHYGHLRTALEVQQALGLEEIRLIPLRSPPHRGALGTDPETRLEMVRAAVADNPVFRVDARELSRAGKSYTLDTLLSLREEIPETPICLLLGNDAFRGFPGWHLPLEILQQAHLVVMERPGEDAPALYPSRHARDADELRAAPGGRVLLQPVTQLEISATQIRALLKRGRSPRYLLPDAVLEIIEQRGLYR